MEPCTKTIWHSTDNLLEPPILSQVSGSISYTHQSKMNVSTSGTYTSGCESEPTDERDQIHLKNGLMKQYLQEQRRLTSVA